VQKKLFLPLVENLIHACDASYSNSFKDTRLGNLGTTSRVIFLLGGGGMSYLGWQNWLAGGVFVLSFWLSGGCSNSWDKFATPVAPNYSCRTGGDGDEKFCADKTSEQTVEYEASKSDFHHT